MKLPVDNQSRIDATCAENSVVLYADAGSGKTTVLEVRYLNCLLKSNQPEDVLVLTFTNAAAGEIRSRILSLLQDASSDLEVEGPRQNAVNVAKQVLKRSETLGWHLLKNPSRMRLLTFDSYAAMLSEKLPVLSGQFSQGKVVDDTTLLYRETILDLFERINDQDCPAELSSALEAMLGYCNYRMEDIVPYFTNLLATRDQWIPTIGSLDMGSVESAINQYFDSVIEKVSMVADLPKFKEFISAIETLSQTSEKMAWLSSLNYESLMSGDAQSWQMLSKLLLTTGGTFRKKFTAREGIAAKSPYSELCNDALEDIAAISSASQWKGLNAVFSFNQDSYDYKAIESIYTVLLHLLAHLETTFKETGSKDFIQVALAAQKSLGNDEIGYGDAMLDEESLQHILVDEMQDTSLSQMRLLSLLTRELSDHNTNTPDFKKTVFFCGDSQQSIYLFRNAEPGIFSDLVNTGKFNGLNLNVLNLTTNFRSQQKNIDFINEVGVKVFPAVGDSNTGDAAFLKADSFDESGKGSVDVFSYPEGAKDCEATAIADQVKRLSATGDSVAILTTTRNQVDVLISKLQEEGIAVNGCDINPIHDKASVKTVISLIKALWHDLDTVSWLGLLRSDLIGMCWSDCLHVSNFANQHGTSIQEVIQDPSSVSDLSEDGAHRSAYLGSIIAEARANQDVSNHLGRLVRHVWVELNGDAFYDNTSSGDVRRIFDVLDQTTEAGRLESLESFDRKVGRLFATTSAKSNITIMTIHKSKGLEFDHVILTGLGHSLPPNRNPLLAFERLNGTLVPAILPQNGDSEVYNLLQSLRRKKLGNEQKRLFYVAATRQKKTLSIYAPVKSSDKGLKVKPNSMLGSVWNAVLEAVEPIELEDVQPATPATPMLERATTRMSPALSELRIRNKQTAEESNDLNHAAFDLQAKWLDIESRVLKKILHACAKKGSNCIGSLRSRSLKPLESLLVRMGYPKSIAPQAIHTLLDQADNLLNHLELGKQILNSSVLDQPIVFNSKSGKRKMADLLVTINGQKWALSIMTSRKHKNETHQQFTERLLGSPILDDRISEGVRKIMSIKGVKVGILATNNTEVIQLAPFFNELKTDSI